MATNGFKLVGGATNEALKARISKYGTRSLWYVGSGPEFGKLQRGGEYTFGTVAELKATLRLLDRYGATVGADCSR